MLRTLIQLRLILLQPFSNSPSHSTPSSTTHWQLRLRNLQPKHPPGHAGTVYQDQAMTDHSKTLQMARARNETREDTELRLDIPKWVMGVIDAENIARGSASSRKEVVNEILSVWAERKVHEATVVLRLANVNPTPLDSKAGSHG